ncbi:MAG TPA: EamA family transporter, partial [Thermoanaerobaculia bacterium]|nr:EamA family transporter [Thermoanaerobaculia bacterium]
MSEVDRTEPLSIRVRADTSLFLITFVWGSSFVVVKNVLRDAPPLGFVFFRFLLATLVCLLIALRRPRTPGLLRDGATIGALLAAGMVLQVLGQ